MRICLKVILNPWINKHVLKVSCIVVDFLMHSLTVYNNVVKVVATIELLTNFDSVPFSFSETITIDKVRVRIGIPVVIFFSVDTSSFTIG